MGIVYVYYNPINNTFYFTTCLLNNFLFDDIGVKKRYSSILVQKMIIYNGKIYDLFYYIDMKEKQKNFKILKKREKFLKRNKRKAKFKLLIDHLIDLLYKLKSRF